MLTISQLFIYPVKSLGGFPVDSAVLTDRGFQYDRRWMLVDENNQITSLSDGYPLLIIGQSSLDDLNSRLAEPLPINRFRPNIVFTGGAPFEEDLLEHFIINGINFSAVKPCARCV